jgi:hypothetical protein
MLAQILQVSGLPNQPINLQIHSQLLDRRARPRNTQLPVLLLSREIRTRKLLLDSGEYLDSPSILHLLRFLFVNFGGEGAGAAAWAVHIGPSGFRDGAVGCCGGDAAGGAVWGAAGLDAGDEAVAALGLEGGLGWRFAVETPRKEGIVDELRILVSLVTDEGEIPWLTASSTAMTDSLFCRSTLMTCSHVVR